ncbi:MAG: hypothetical protein ISR99_01070 [Parcubacteria group bacterium]|nr:hypothetical protein [Parcubacteria group bacterium]
MAEVVPMLPLLPSDWEVWSGKVVSQSKAYDGRDHEAEVWPTGKCRDSLDRHRFVFFTSNSQKVDVGTGITLKVPNEPERFERMQTFDLNVLEQVLKQGFKVFARVLRLGPHKRTYLYKYLK